MKKHINAAMIGNHNISLRFHLIVWFLDIYVLFESMELFFSWTRFRNNTVPATTCRCCNNCKQKMRLHETLWFLTSSRLFTPEHVQIKKECWQHVIRKINWNGTQKWILDSSNSSSLFKLKMFHANTMYFVYFILVSGFELTRGFRRVLNITLLIYGRLNLVTKKSSFTSKCFLGRNSFIETFPFAWLQLVDIRKCSWKDRIDEIFPSSCF